METLLDWTSTIAVIFKNLNYDPTQLSSLNAHNRIAKYSIKVHRLIGARRILTFVDLISASLVAPEKRKCDENNNSSKSVTDEEAKSSTQTDDDGDDEKVEKTKPKQMVGLFPLDLRSELKQRVGGKVGFSLKKSSTNVDIFEKKKKTESDPIAIKLPEIKSNRPSDLLKIQENQMRRKVQDDSDDEGGQEKLSFKEKLQLIERSSSKSLVNPL